MGDTFDVEVWLDDVVDLGGFEFCMSYNPSVVHVQTVRLGPFLGSTGRSTAPLGPTVDNSAGTLLFGGFSFGSDPGASVSGILAIITLEAVGAGTSALHLYDVQVTDTQAQPLSVTTADGSVDVHNHWGESWSGSGTGLTLSSSDGIGLRGQSNATSGITYGVYGLSKSTAGRGVYGYATASSGTTYGLYGLSKSTKGRGVYGYANATSGVTYGVYGYNKSISGRGVYGYTAATSGVTYGVYGYNKSTSGRGVYGYAAATSGSTTGVYGKVRSPNGWAGRFISSYGNGVYISVPAGKAGLNVASGMKNGIVPTADGARLLYAEEATEVWFADYGFGKLDNGVAVVPIDPIFAQTVNLDEPYHVFLQVYGDAEVYVSERTAERFEVRLSEGDISAPFLYRLVAKRLGYEGERLERAPWADDDPNLYPEKLAEWEAQEEMAEPAEAPAEPEDTDSDGPNGGNGDSGGSNEAPGGSSTGMVAASHDHWGESWSGSGTGLTLASSDGTGLRGQSNATSGATNGVYGLSKSTAGRGVFGYATATSGTTYGLYGLSKSTSGRGVYGYANATTGVTYGVYGNSKSTSGRGVYGYASATSGNTYGVYGNSKSNKGLGVYGYADATSGSTTGVYGVVRSPNGWAGKFTSSYGNGVYISVPAGKAGLNVASGSKNGIVPTADGARLLYTEEATEVWFADYGFGKLQDGLAVVAIDPIFAQTVNLDEPYHVFLQAYGDAEVYVSEHTAERFEVRLREGGNAKGAKGDPDVPFSYRLVASRLGYEGERLERAPWADDDPNLYPEKLAGWEAQEGVMEPLELEEGEELPEEPLAPQPTEAQAEATDSDREAGEGAGSSTGMAAASHNHWGQSWSGSGTGLTLASSDGTGVRGQSNATSGATYGVYGLSKSTAGRGVFGYATASSGTTYGLYGLSKSTSGRGVYGYANATTGVTYGVYGNSKSTSGRGVYGYASATSGTTYGVYGQSKSNRGRAVYGYAAATSGATTGVYGVVRSPNGWAGRFISSYGNGVYISVPAGKAGLNVANGSKNAVVPTADGARLLYAEEATEVWFADYGFGKLQDGVAVMPIDPIFAQTVNLGEPYYVFVQVYGDASVYVGERTSEQFEVRLREGDPDAAFSYRLVAKRLGYEPQRLERAPWADDDPNLYPEKRAEWEVQDELAE